MRNFGAHTRQFASIVVRIVYYFDGFYMYWRNGDERSSISATVRLMLSLINQGQKGVMCHRYNGMGRGHFKFPLMVPLSISTLLLIHRYSHKHTAPTHHPGAKISPAGGLFFSGFNFALCRPRPKMGLSEW